MSKKKIPSGWYRLTGDGYPHSPDKVWQRPEHLEEVVHYGEDASDYRTYAWILVLDGEPVGLEFIDDVDVEFEPPNELPGWAAKSFASYLTRWGFTREQIVKRLIGAPLISDWEEEFEFT